MTETRPTDLVYITCACGEPLTPPFSRHSGPVFFVHTRGARHFARWCKIIATPHPTAPDYDERHRVILIPRGDRYETVLVRELKRWREQGGSAVAEAS